MPLAKRILSHVKSTTRGQNDISAHYLHLYNIYQYILFLHLLRPLLQFCLLGRLHKTMSNHSHGILQSDIINTRRIVRD